MAFWKQDRPCPDCGKALQEVETLRDEMRRHVLRYEELYEIVRRNLSKLAARAKEQGVDEQVTDPLAEARAALAAKKLRRLKTGSG